MNRNVRYGLLVLCMFACSVQGDSNQFVKEKKGKKVSVARLKEDIGEVLGQSLLHSTKVIEEMGALQRELIQMTGALIEQPKDSKLTQADRLALDKTLTELTTIECELSALTKRLSQHIEVVKKQY